MRKIKVYVAAPWVHKDAAKAAATQLEEAGFEVTSRWLNLPDGPPASRTDGTPEFIARMKEEALHDLEDIYYADGMIVLQLAKSEGKAFEQGVAIHLVPNKIIVVSPDGTKGNVFQYLENMYTVVPTLEAAIEEAKDWSPAYIIEPGMPSTWKPIPVGEEYEIISGGPILES